MSDQKLHLYSPTISGGSPEHFNWFGADHVNIIGKETTGHSSKKGGSPYPGSSGNKAFAHISDKDWASDNKRATYNIGLLNNGKNGYSSDRDIFFDIDRDWETP